MRIRHSCVAAAFVACLMGGCVSTPAGSSGTSTQPTRSHGSRDVITAEELANIDVQNALEAVQRLRPNFLQTRGGAASTSRASGQNIVVYVDQTRMGGPSSLAQIPITDVKEIQYLSGPDATQRYGTGHSAGAIVVLRK